MISEFRNHPERLWRGISLIPAGHPERLWRGISLIPAGHPERAFNAKDPNKTKEVKRISVVISDCFLVILSEAKNPSRMRDKPETSSEILRLAAQDDSNILLL